MSSASSRKRHLRQKAGNGDVAYNIAKILTTRQSWGPLTFKERAISVSLTTYLGLQKHGVAHSRTPVVHNKPRVQQVGHPLQNASLNCHELLLNGQALLDLNSWSRLEFFHEIHDGEGSSIQMPLLDSNPFRPSQLVRRLSWISTVGLESVLS